MGRRRSAGLAFALAVGVMLVFTLSGAASSGGGDRDFEAELLGANEVPPADPDGEGEGEFEFKVKKGKVCFELEWDDITTPHRAHIHSGEAGVNGGIVVSLFDVTTQTDTAAAALQDELESDDEFEDCVPVEKEIAKAIKANPDAYYCNIHNLRFPGGAIRGQLEKD